MSWRGCCQSKDQQSCFGGATALHSHDTRSLVLSKQWNHYSNMTSECQIMETDGSKTTRMALMELFCEYCHVIQQWSALHGACFSLNLFRHRFDVFCPTDQLDAGKELSTQSSDVVITIKVNLVRNSISLHCFEYILGWSQPVNNLGSFCFLFRDVRKRVATGESCHGLPIMQLLELCWALIVAKQALNKIIKFTIKDQCIPVHKALVWPAKCFMRDLYK